MRVYYTFRDIAFWIGQVRSTLTQVGIDIQDVWLIGDWLSGWFLVLSARLSGAEGELYSLASDWLEFYNWLGDKLDIGTGLDLLLQYADDLISFILDPDYYIINFLRARFPSVYDFFHSPVYFIIDALERYTGLDYDFIYDPIGKIRQVVDAITAGIQSFLYDPQGFIISKLAEVTPEIYEFLYDVRGWLRGRVYDAFPFVFELLEDPQGYIEDHIIDILERVKERHQARILQLVESILQAIF